MVPPQMNRRDFLVGNVSGACVGAIGGLLGARYLGGSHVEEPKAAIEPGAPAAASAPTPPGCPQPTGLAADPDLAYATLSFAQNGEDLVLRQFLQHVLHVEKPDYIDIGAWEPIASNNTYLFYRAGGKGVLVEPNPAKCDKIRAARPRDTVVNVGIAGKGSPPVADYYIIEGDGQLNTFDKAEVEKLKKNAPNCVKEVRKMPLVDVNKVLKDNFSTAPPSLFSIDTEGMDLSILETLDFKAWRCKVFIVEASLENGRLNPEIEKLMTSNGYLFRGGNIVNAVFIDGNLLST